MRIAWRRHLAAHVSWTRPWPLPCQAGAPQRRGRDCIPPASALEALSHLRVVERHLIELETRKERCSMSVIAIRARMKEEHVADVETALKRVFAALDREQLEGVRYGSFRLADGVTFLALLEIEDGVDNPLLALPEFQDLQVSLPEWHAEPPEAGPATVVGSYRLFPEPSRQDEVRVA